MGFETQATIRFHKRHVTEEVKELVLKTIFYNQETLEEDDICVDDYYAEVSEYWVSHGEFPELEDYFKKNEISFDRISEDEDGIMWKYSFRPNEYEGKVQVTNNGHEPFLTISEIKEVLESLYLKNNLINLIKEKYPTLSPLD